MGVCSGDRSLDDLPHYLFHHVQIGIYSHSNLILRNRDSPGASDGILGSPKRKEKRETHGKPTIVCISDKYGTLSGIQIKIINQTVKETDCCQL